MPFDPELPAKRVRQLTLSGDVSWTLEIVGYFASKEWGYPMDVTESGDYFLGAGGLSQRDAQHRMRSPDSIGFLSYIMIF